MKKKVISCEIYKLIQDYNLQLIAWGSQNIIIEVQNEMQIEEIKHKFNYYNWVYDDNFCDENKHFLSFNYISFDDKYIWKSNKRVAYSNIVISLILILIFVILPIYTRNIMIGIAGIPIAIYSLCNLIIWRSALLFKAEIKEGKLWLKKSNFEIVINIHEITHLEMKKSKGYRDTFKIYIHSNKYIFSTSLLDESDAKSLYKVLNKMLNL
jgi:hypothetical protein